jgi:hypothetical protein
MSLSKSMNIFLNDSKKFLFLAKNEERQKNEKMQQMYSRAVIITSYCALEGFLNYIALSFSKTKSSDLSDFEKAFLLEKKIEINEKGRVILSNQDKYESTTKKLIFIFNKFGNYDIKKNNPKFWDDFKNCEKLRNALVHPKKRDELYLINLKEAESTYKTISLLIDLLKTRIFS